MSFTKYTKLIRLDITCKEPIGIEVNKKKVALPSKIFNIFEYTLNISVIQFLSQLFSGIYFLLLYRGKFSLPSQNFVTFLERKILPVL